MTKEEIIHRLQYARHRIDNITYAPDVLKAIDIAIETVGNTDADTISRKGAIDALRKMQTYKLFSGDDMLLIDQAGAQTELMMLPPAQPERIIRCKYCKHWIPYDWMFSEMWQSKNMADYPEDEIGCNYCDMAMKANDFCSRAERREVTT